ncbi:GNAT family N-acetyltransferase [Streptomyces sp. NPDC057428]|uniref:GNAT family N-acetyltransferase n=1 Tax=Streptomyces sp. NPDC057428 TaxID=3346129 RepID=UPI0036738972
MPHLLDLPVRASLTAGHARFARQRGRVLRYAPDLAAFAALPDRPDLEDWADAAVLAGPGGVLSLVGQDPELPEGWRTVSHVRGVQLVARRPVTTHDNEIRELTPADIPEMAALIQATRPGPFPPGSHRCTTYFGVRRSGSLVAMGGLRMRPAGHTEISTVCTLPEYRRRGLARRVVGHLSALVTDQGNTPFLHAEAGQEVVTRLYGSLGFEPRSDLSLREIAAPSGGARPTRREPRTGYLVPPVPKQREPAD